MIVASFGEAGMFGTVLAIAVAALSAQVAQAPLHFDCTGPVTQTTPAAAILTRFGRDARRGDVMGADGRPVRGVILYPDDPARRLEIAFWDDAQTAMSSVTADARATAWTGPLGLHAGSTLAEVIAVNGHNFSLSGFDWHYGGYITSFWNGKLLKLDGGCAAQIRLGLPADAKLPKAIVGERDLNSTLADVKAAGPRIDRLSIGWPLPAGVKASDRGGETLGF